MASDRWKESEGSEARRERKETPGAGGASPAIPDFVRRALSAGFSSFFLTGEALREALGDSLPKEWADFAAEQSTRARSELIERLSVELGRAVENVDWSAVLAKLLAGHTLEVNARVRVVESDEGGRPGLRVKLEED